MNHQEKIVLERIGLILLAALCIVSFVWFFITARALYRAGDLRPDYDGRHQNRQLVTINTIEPWMTFNYLNVVFDLPPQYLQNTLSITDPHYPNIRIDLYASHAGQNSMTLLQTIQKAISNYNMSK